MFARFYVEPDTEEFREIIAEAVRSPLARKFVHAGYAVLQSGEMRPSNVLPVIAPDRSGRQAVFPMKWGFQIPGQPLLVNARCETAAEKPSFREAWERRRCIIPASWYYEWEHMTGADGRKKTGDKYMIQPRGSQAVWLCGLYRIEEGLPCFTVLTRDPEGALRKIHDRMPLSLPKERVSEWIRPDTKPEKLLPYALTDMIFEKSI